MKWSGVPSPGRLARVAWRVSQIFARHDINRCLCHNHSINATMRKRSQPEDSGDEESPTPKKTRRGANLDVEPSAQHLDAPTVPKSILTPTKANGRRTLPGTPSSLRKVLFTTPSKNEKEDDGAEEEDEDDEHTPTISRNDLSARRKSQRTLLNHVDGDDSSDAEDEQDQAIAQAILNGDDDEDEISVAATSEPATPSKTGRPRGRPKGRRKERTPSPPPDLPPHELYFFQNRAGANKTSSNTIPGDLLLNHDDYFAQIELFRDPHTADIERLKRLHKRAFDQWVFELEEGFNVCLYGYGSKRNIIMEFADFLYHGTTETPKIVVANAYTPGFVIRDILSSIASAALPKNTKLPAQPGPMLDALLAALSELPSGSRTFLFIHSLDHVNLRKGPTPTMLGRLASHPNISIIASCDTPIFPLIWDVTLSKQFRFLFHDATTFEPYKAELEVVEDVNTLLGRSGRRLGGKDGVGYVLKSLPENARSLFRILVAEQLALADSEGEIVFDGLGDDSDNEDLLGVEDDEAAAEQQTPSRRGRGRPKAVKKQAPKAASVTKSQGALGVEYRTLYHKAVEEFVCSSEVSFRTLLKEFHDHQMIESRKDSMGTERLVIPFRRDELESILEDLV